MTDVLIIGSGWAGTYASLLLAQQGKKVLVLEARQRLGGRMFTHTWTPESIASSDPNVRTGRNATTGTSGVQHAIDLGGAWAHGFHEGSPLRKLAAQYGAKIEVAKPTATKIVGPKGAIPDEVANRLQGNLGAAQGAAQAVAADSATTGNQQDLSLAKFLLNSESPLYTDLKGDEAGLATDLARLLHVPLGVPLEQAALQWTGYEKGFAGTDGTPVGGFQVLHSKLVEEAKSKGVEFLTGQVVTQVSERPAEKKVTVTTQEGKRYEAPAVLVTIPLAVLEKSPALFEPKLPERRQQLIRQTKVGSLNKILLHYDTVWWDNPDAGTLIVLPMEHSSIDLSTASVPEILSRATLLVLPQSAPSGLSDRTPTLFTLIGAEHGAALERFSLTEVTEGAHAYFASRLTSNATSVPHPIHSFRSAWTTHPFTRGATTTPIVVGSGSPLDFFELGRPLWNGTLGFAGEHTEIDHHGSIAGAILSGEREANRLGSWFEVRALKEQQQKL